MNGGKKAKLVGRNMTQEHFLYGKDKVLQAILVPSSASFGGVRFLTSPDNDLQIALMTRDSNSPVPAHQHLETHRVVNSTQEFIWIRSGQACVSIYNQDNTISNELIMSSGDSILLISGGHKIDFLTTTELLEVKQGPYQQMHDKIYLRTE